MRRRREKLDDPVEKAIPAAKDPHPENQRQEAETGRTKARTKESYPCITTEQAPNKIHNEGGPGVSHGISTDIQATRRGSGC
jgi:hypothetical protein